MRNYLMDKTMKSGLRTCKYSHNTLSEIKSNSGDSNLPSVLQKSAHAKPLKKIPEVKKWSAYGGDINEIG